MDRERVYVRVKNLTWTDGRGRTIKLHSMADRHLDNSIRLIERRLREGDVERYGGAGKQREWLKALRLERERRDMEREF